jgi:uncharacterized membrane protein YhiD involved in acid resistance
LIGAAVFTMMSLVIGEKYGEPGRIAAQIVSRIQ